MIVGRQVEIGALRERVEVIEEPGSGPGGRIGRIRHANGENVAIDDATLRLLVQRARDAGTVLDDRGQPSGRAVLWA